VLVRCVETSFWFLRTQTGEGQTWARHENYFQQAKTRENQWRFFFSIIQLIPFKKPFEMRDFRG
jgi:hypothetical protein